MKGCINAQFAHVASFECTGLTGTIVLLELKNQLPDGKY